MFTIGEKRLRRRKLVRKKNSYYITRWINDFGVHFSKLYTRKNIQLGAHGSPGKNMPKYSKIKKVIGQPRNFRVTI